jgi:hypothetical protein
VNCSSSSSDRRPGVAAEQLVLAGAEHRAQQAAAAVGPRGDDLELGLGRGILDRRDVGRGQELVAAAGVETVGEADREVPGVGLAGGQRLVGDHGGLGELPQIDLGQRRVGHGLDVDVDDLDHQGVEVQGLLAAGDGDLASDGAAGDHVGGVERDR